MIDHAEQIAKDNNASCIQLDIRETQKAAIHLFESKGYQQWGEINGKVEGALRAAGENNQGLPGEGECRGHRGSTPRTFQKICQVLD